AADDQVFGASRYPEPTIRIYIAEVACVEPAVRDERALVVLRLTVTSHHGRPLQRKHAYLARSALRRSAPSAVEAKDAGLDIRAAQPNRACREFAVLRRAVGERSGFGQTVTLHEANTGVRLERAPYFDRNGRRPAAEAPQRLELRCARRH